jgi:hypothetical protein
MLNHKLFLSRPPTIDSQELVGKKIEALPKLQMLAPPMHVGYARNFMCSFTYPKADSDNKLTWSEMPVNRDKKKSASL